MVAKVCNMHTRLLITMVGQRPAHLFTAQPNYNMTLNIEESLDQPLEFN